MLRATRYVHVANDDHTRVAFISVHPDETSWNACLALLQAMRYYASLGILFTRALTENGVCYRSRCFQRLRLKHGRTKPYSPHNNGKAERFTQTALREWAYARSYASSAERGRHLPASINTTGTGRMPVWMITLWFVGWAFPRTT